MAVAEEKLYQSCAALKHESAAFKHANTRLRRRTRCRFIYSFASWGGADRSWACLLNAIQPVQQRVEDAANLVKQVANGEVGQLRLGFTGTSMLNPLIPKCVRYFQQQYPKVNLKLEEANTLLLIDLLLEDRLDVAIIRSPRNMPDSLILQELLAEPLIAALPSESFNSTMHHTKLI